MTHEHIHTDPLVRGVDETKPGKRRERPSQPNIRGPSTFNNHKQAHAEKGKAINEVDRNDVWCAEDQICLVLLV